MCSQHNYILKYMVKWKQRVADSAPLYAKKKALHVLGMHLQSLDFLEVEKKTQEHSIQAEIRLNGRTTCKQ